MITRTRKHSLAFHYHNDPWPRRKACTLQLSEALSVFAKFAALGPLFRVHTRERFPADRQRNACAPAMCIIHAWVSRVIKYPRVPHSDWIFREWRCGTNIVAPARASRLFSRKATNCHGFRVQPSRRHTKYQFCWTFFPRIHLDRVSYFRSFIVHVYLMLSTFLRLFLSVRFFSPRIHRNYLADRYSSYSHFCSIVICHSIPNPYCLSALFV